MNRIGASVGRAAAAWVAWVQRYAVGVTLLILLAAGGSLYYSAGHIGINTNNADMISPKVPWRQAYIDYQHAFPQFTDNLVVVLDAQTPGLAESARRRLVAALRAEPQMFTHVYSPGGGAFFRRNGLLYLSVDELNTLAEQLVRIQPVIGRLADSPSLQTLSMLMSRVLESDDARLRLDPVFTRLTAAFNANRADRFHRVAWQSLMSGKAAGDGDTRRLIELQPKLNFNDLAPAAKAMARVREIAAGLDLNAAHGVRVHLTGSAALESEELASVSQGAALGASLALLAVALILLAALRSLRLVFASLLTLIAGLSITAAFAAAVVGTLNMISVAFAVLYIGLGIDYAIHLCLRYRELVRGGKASNAAMQTAAFDVGTSLLICAVTTAVGFYAFIPTAYAGIAQLGLISGTGMFISLVVTLTLLPALLALLPLPCGMQAKAPAASPGRLASLPQTRRAAMLAVTALLAVGAAALLPLVHFNANTLDLKNPNTESVRTYRDLLAQGQAPQSIAALAPDPDSANRLRARLAALTEVGRAVSIASFVPGNQREKLAVIRDLALTLSLSQPVSLSAHRHPPAERYRAVERLGDAVSQYLQRNPEAKTGPAGNLHAALEKWNTAYSKATPAVRRQRLADLQANLLGTLPARLSDLRQSLSAQSVTLDSLPRALRRRWVSPDGRYRVAAFARDDIGNASARRHFVAAVQSVVPHATGQPVLELAAGDTVVSAFFTAFTYAAAGIALLLLLLLRSVADTLRVLAPLALVALLVAACSVLLGIPFNFANIIALPLLLGVGVDNGIHVVHRMRTAPPPGGVLLASSTARAVLFSSLTTIAGFGALAFSHHAGTASLGELLALGMALTLFVTLIVLPALLPRRDTASKPI